MTTFAPPAVESDIRDQPAPAPVAPSGEQTGAVESHVNGLATQANNNMDESPPTLKPYNDPPIYEPTGQPASIVPDHSSIDVPSKPLPEQAVSDSIMTDASSAPLHISSTAVAEDNPVSSTNIPTPSAESAINSSDNAIESQFSPDNVQVSESQSVTSFPPVAQTVVEEIALAAAVVPETQDSSILPASPPSTQLEEAKLNPITSETALAPTPIANTEPKDEEMVDAPHKVTREREEDDDIREAPAAKRTKTEDDTPTLPETATVLSDPAPAPTPAPAPASEVAAQPAAEISSISGAAPAAVAAPAPTPAAQGPNFAPPQATPSTDSSPMSELQKKKLMDGMRNLKKAKNAINFLKPVDHEALGLPNYPNVVKRPMDLGTIETKLRDDKYESVDAYAADWDLMINNAVAFNGQAHLVAQQGMMLRAQLQAQLRKLPKVGEVVQPAPKKQQTSLAGAIRDTPRRVPAAPPAPTTPAATSETFAAPNGVPTIRRGSSVGGRPKREIHKPTRDLAYQSAKPIKKKHKAEIDFCKHVLEEMTRPRYEQLFIPFYKPVDPVALAIPHYFSLIKKPMSLSVVKEKLNTNQYETAKEVEADVKLIWANCYKYNGKNHAVSNMAVSYEKLFDEEFSKKNEWIATHAPASAPQSPVDDSGSEEDDEEEEEDPEAAEIAMIQRQMQELQEKTMALLEAKAKKAGGPKKGKGVGKGAPGKKRKSTSLGGAKIEKKVSKPKNKERAVTVAEKQEISSKIGDLNAEQITKAADLIKASLRKIGRHDLADKAEDDMEFDIDQIPNDALHDLLKLVRKASAPAPLEESSYSAKSSYLPSKPKKNKPMSKAEQEDHIRRLQGQLANFDNGVAVGSPTGEDDSSEDEEEESGSSSEEE